MWTKTLHVESSLPEKRNQYAFFLGRFQPLHKGHQELFYQALKHGKNILIGIRDIPVDENNPFTSEQIKQNIESIYAEQIQSKQVIVMIMPCDIGSIEFGRGVGYNIIEHIPPVEISDISATKIRAKMRENGEL